MKHIEEQVIKFQIRLHQSADELNHLSLYLAAVEQHICHVDDAGILRRKKLQCFFDDIRLPNAKEDLLEIKSQNEKCIDVVQSRRAELQTEIASLNSLNAKLGSHPGTFADSVELSRITEVINSVEIAHQHLRQPLMSFLRLQIEENEHAIRQILDGESDSLLWEEYETVLEIKRRTREQAESKKKISEQRDARNRINERRKAEKYIQENPKAIQNLARLEEKHAKTKLRLKKLEQRKKDVISDLTLKHQGRVAYHMSESRIEFNRGMSSSFSVTGSPRSHDLDQVIDQFSDYFPSLRNVKRQIDEIESLLRAEENEIEKAGSVVAKVKKAKFILSHSVPSTLSASKRPKKVVLEWRDAEDLAKDFMVFLGFRDASTTSLGADGGVDVTSSAAIGQVKMHNKGVPRYDIQRLVGEASVSQKLPIFFAMSYSRDAISWSEEHGIALYKFERSGDISPMTSKALDLEREK